MFELRREFPEYFVVLSLKELEGRLSVAQHLLMVIGGGVLIMLQAPMAGASNFTLRK